MKQLELRQFEGNDPVPPGAILRVELKLPDWVRKCIEAGMGGLGGYISSLLGKERDKDGGIKFLEGLSLGIGFGKALADDLLSDYHTGVYDGNGLVIELQGSGKIDLVTLSDFLTGLPEDRGQGEVRTGSVIEVLCNEKQKILYTARAAEVANDAVFETIDYDLCKRNCHCFTACCVLGREITNRNLERISQNSGMWFSSRDLDSLLEKRYQRPVKWDPVFPQPGFEYDRDEGGEELDVLPTP